MRWGAAVLLTCAAAGGLLVVSASAQELSPRAYWPAPKGTIAVFTG